MNLYGYNKKYYANLNNDIMQDYVHKLIYPHMYRFAVIVICLCLYFLNGQNVLTLVESCQYTYCTNTKLSNMF